MERGITIFTPTYNRAYRLQKLYESLCDQSCDKFEWLVVDDGSTDSTKEMVNTWRKENKILIRYFWQENAGKAQAHNLGVELAEMQLFTCVDSDDYLLPNAVERIFEIWDKNPDKIGIICARIDVDHNPITYWNGSVKYCTLYDAYRKYDLRGDTMLIYQTELIKKYRFPRFEGEKFVTEAYLYDCLDREGNMYITNEALYVTEYLPDGYTLNSHKLIQENPYGFQAYIIQRLKLDKKWKYIIEDTWQYIAVKQIIKDKCLIKDSVYPVVTCLLFLSTCFMTALRKYIRQFLNH